MMEELNCLGEKAWHGSTSESCTRIIPFMIVKISTATFVIKKEKFRRKFYGATTSMKLQLILY